MLQLKVDFVPDATPVGYRGFAHGTHWGTSLPRSPGYSGTLPHLEISGAATGYVHQLQTRRSSIDVFKNIFAATAGSLKQIVRYIDWPTTANTRRANVLSR